MKKPTEIKVVSYYTEHIEKIFFFFCTIRGEKTFYVRILPRSRPSSHPTGWYH